MRTFPKSLSAFREIVSQRGQRLGGLPYEELQRLKDAPIEHLTVESRPSTIGIIVEQQASGSIRVVVQGFMKARLIPFSSHVALDGFYKHPDGTVLRMPPDEFYEFG